MTPNPLAPEQLQCVKFIARLREKGWTLKAIADRVDASFTSIWRWEQAELAHRNDWERSAGDGIAFPSPSASRRMLPILKRMVAQKARRVGR